MMNNLTVLFGIGISLVIGLIAEQIFRKFRVPDVLFLLLFGALISALGYSTGLRRPSAFLDLLITFSLIYIVFTGSLTTRINELFSTAKWALISSILNLVFITGIVGLVAYIFRFPLNHAIAIGLLMSVVDGTILNRLLEIIKISPKAEILIQMESSILDILVVILFVAVLNFSSVSLSGITHDLVSFIILSSGIGIFLGIIWSFIMKFLEGNNHIAVTTMAVLMLVYFIAEYFEANGAVAITAFSIVIGNASVLKNFLHSDYAQKIGSFGAEQKFFFDNLSFFLSTLLFVYMGAIIDFSKYYYLLLGFLIAFVALAVRSFVYRFINAGDIPKKEFYLIENFSAKGLTSLVLALFMISSTAVVNTVIGGVFFSVIISSILIYMTEQKEFTSLSNKSMHLLKDIIPSSKRKASSEKK